MLSLLVAWRNHGGSRLDRNLDGKIDDPGAAIMDAAWPKIADAFMKPQLGPQLDELNSLFTRFSQPPGGQYDGWYQYFDRDIRHLLGEHVAQPFQNSYCGHGVKSACKQAIWNAIAAAGAELTAAQGTSNPAAWRADATAERIHFAPGPAADDNALHQPPERDPAGDLLQRSSLSPSRVARFFETPSCRPADIEGAVADGRNPAQGSSGSGDTR